MRQTVASKPACLRLLGVWLADAIASAADDFAARIDHCRAYAAMGAGIGSRRSTERIHPV